MKVLHLISGGDKGGAKTHVFTLLSALQEDIFIRVICFMEGVFYQEIKDTDIPSMLIKQRYRNDLTIIEKLITHIRQERYHLIHAHGARANFIAVLLRPFIKIPMITTVHSDYRMDFTDSLYKKMVFTELNSWALRFLDYYIAVSNQFKDMLSERDFDKDRIYTVYNSIDFEMEIEFTPKEQFLQLHGVNHEGKTIIGIIGRFDKVKGHEIFIKAAINIIKKRKDVIFLLAGEGPEQNNLQNMIKAAKVSEHFVFLGFINDIFSFVNCIDINVLSSYSESFPYVLLEGAKMSKPTVSTAVGGIPDLIKDGETGLLVEPANFEQMAEKIEVLLENKIFAKKLGDNLNIFARSNFSKESMKLRHLEIYTDIIKRTKEANKCFDVMLSGYYGFKNSGDDALLKAIIESLRQEKPDISIAVLSKNPKETSQRHNVYAINRSNLLAIRKHLKMSRLFLNGGGSLIQDITSTQSLFYYTTLMHFAKKLGLKVMLYANGIGPIIKKHNIGIAKSALQICDFITLRETESINELKKLGVTNKEVLFTSDPTFSLKPIETDALEDIFKKEKIDKNGKYLSVSIRQWKYNDINFVQKMADIINEICLKYDLIPLFIPMQQPYDAIISKEVSERLSVKSIVLSQEYNAQEIMALIGITQLVIAMRLHTLIYAVSMNVPIIGIVYDPKIKSFMNYIKQETYVNCFNLDKKEVIDIAEQIMNNTADVKSEINIQSEQLKAYSNRDAKIAIELIER